MIEANSLGMQRDHHIIFSKLSFSLNPGELFLVRGHNGSGKTALLRMLAGLLPVTEGKLSVVPIPLYLGHQLGLHPALNPVENLEGIVCLLLEGQYDRALLISALKRWGLGPVLHQPCGKLSRGQQQRVALARLAISGLSFWVLDEPMAHLDEQANEMFKEDLQKHLHDGGFVVMATHEDIPEIEQQQTLVLGG